MKLSPILAVLVALAIAAPAEAARPLTHKEARTAARAWASYHAIVGFEPLGCNVLTRRRGRCRVWIDRLLEPSCVARLTVLVSKRKAKPWQLRHGRTVVTSTGTCRP